MLETHEPSNSQPHVNGGTPHNVTSEGR